MPLNPTDTDALTDSAERYVSATRAHLTAPNDFTAKALHEAEQHLHETARNYVRPIAPTETLLNKTYDNGQIRGYRAHSNGQGINSVIDGRPLR